MPPEPSPALEQPLLWPRPTWCTLVGGLSTSAFHRDRELGFIETIRLGGRTKVKTPPAVYIAAKLAAQAGSAERASQHARQRVEARRAKRQHEAQHPTTS